MVEESERTRHGIRKQEIRRSGGLAIHPLRKYHEPGPHEERRYNAGIVPHGEAYWINL